MTNVELKMPKDIRIPKHESRGYSVFDIRF